VRIETWHLLVKNGAVNSCAAFVNVQTSAEINAAIIAAQQVHGVTRWRKCCKDRRIASAGRGSVVHGQGRRASRNAYKDAFKLACSNLDLNVSVVIVKIKRHDFSLCQEFQLVQRAKIYLNDIIYQLLQ
jgi:hypothetical protein